MTARTFEFYSALHVCTEDASSEIRISLLTSVPAGVVSAIVQFLLAAETEEMQPIYFSKSFYFEQLKNGKPEDAQRQA